MTRRGRVLRDTNVGPGLLTVDGKQYAFLLEGMWRSEVPPRTGMTVDVGFDAQGAPAEVYAVAESQIAREQAQKALGGALRHGGALGASVGSGLKGRFGVVAIAAELIMLLAFFALPGLRIGGFGERVLSGWDVIGLNPKTQAPSDHGFLSLLAILCLFVPAAVPFLRQAWARWLNAAPLGFAVLALITVGSQIHTATAAVRGVGEAFGGAAGGEMARQFGPSYSMAVGGYVAILCALYLASQSLRRN